MAPASAAHDSEWYRGVLSPSSSALFQVCGLLIKT
jgi:hypothetical protein